MNNCIPFLLFAQFLSLSAGAIAQSPRTQLELRRDPQDQSVIVCDITTATVKTPSGWQPNRSDGPSIVIFTPKASVEATPERMITVDVGRPTCDSLKETAAAFAKKWNGHVSAAPVQLDAVAALRVTVPGPNATLKPSECIICHFGGLVYLIIGGTKRGISIHDAIESIVKGWHWKPSVKSNDR